MYFSVFGVQVEPWIFALFAWGGFVWELARLRLAMYSEFWPSAPGTVHEADIEDKRDSEGDEYYVVRVRYSFVVGAERYEGDRLAFRPRQWSSYAAATKAVSGVRASGPHKVYFHPRHPRLSVLKPGATGMNYFVVIVLFGLMILAMCVHANA